MLKTNREQLPALALNAAKMNALRAKKIISQYTGSEMQSFIANEKQEEEINNKLQHKRKFTTQRRWLSQKQNAERAGIAIKNFPTKKKSKKKPRPTSFRGRKI